MDNSTWLKNSELYETGKYLNYDILPIIDINNLTINIKTFQKLIEILNFWNLYKPYSIEIYIFLIHLFYNKYYEVYDYLHMKKVCNSTEQYFLDLFSDKFRNDMVGEFIYECNSFEIIQYVNDNNILNRNDMLIQLCRYNSFDYIKILLSLSSKVNQSDDIREVLLNSAEYGHLDTIIYLVDNGADISIHEYYPFRIAANKGHLDIIKYFVSKCKDENEVLTMINSRYNEALKIASRRGYSDIVNYLSSLTLSSSSLIKNDT